MRTHYCVDCQKQSKIEWWRVSTTWDWIDKRFYWTHLYECPCCKRKEPISFWKMPIKAKLQFLKEWLESIF